tara:strand:+ start:16864 stop:20100 length:3237 start_codon:yes stop_codon:yes gene_type:complete
MAKDKVEVPSIQIGANTPGFAFGGVIYSADSQVGYSGNPTNLNVNVALDSQIYEANGFRKNFQISNNDLNLASPVDIKFAGSNLFRNMFLSSYEESVSVEDKLLHLTYSDGSVLLDRIFVGLIHEHFEVDRVKHTVPNSIEFKLKCPLNEFHTIDTVGGRAITYPVCSETGYSFVDRKTLRFLANASGSATRPYKIIRQSQQNIWSGGYMVLGAEEFSEQKCSLADVSYSFTDLMNATRQFGIAVDLSRFPDRRDNKYFRKNYSGTLKDVLQNWGNDFGVSFYWDFTKLLPTLVVVDLTDKSIQSKFESAIVGIDALDKGHGADFTQGSNIIINSKNHTRSLDGTFAQAFSSKFNRGPGAKERNRRRSAAIQFGCQRLQSLAGGRGTIMGRSINDFFISMTLGKFAPDLRDIYNTRRAATVYSNITEDSTGTAFNLSSGYFHAIGFVDALGLTFGKETGALSSAKEELMVFSGLPSQISQATIQQVGDKQVLLGPNGANYHAFCGIRDENVKEYVNSVEQAIANEFYGRHYVLSAPASEHFECNRFYKILEKLEVEPSATFYGGNQHYKSPMSKFIQSINDLKIDSLTQSGIAYQNNLVNEIGELSRSLADQCSNDINTQKRKNGFFHFERNAPWMASKEDIDRILNPFVLNTQNTNVSSPSYIKSSTQPRVKTNILRDYTPIMAEVPIVQQFLASLGNMKSASKPIARLYAMTKDQQAVGKHFNMCLFLSNRGFDAPAGRIGDIVISGIGFTSNVIEEINALSSLCDRQSTVTADDTEDCKTLCEGDLAEEMCSSTELGQAGLNCGEREAIKDALYHKELLDDRGRIKGRSISISRRNLKVSTADGTTENLYADVAVGASEISKTSITAPSENNHAGVLIYTRNMTTTDFGVRKVFDGLDKASSAPLISPKVSSIKYQVQDLTQDVGAIFSEDNQAAILRGEIPLQIIDDFVGVDSDDKLESFGDTNYVKLGIKTAEDYHNLIKNNLTQVQVDTVRENVTYKIYIDAVGGLSQLSAYLKQENGLDSLSISRDENGFYLTVAMSNRPPVVPELEAIFRKVGPISKALQPKMSFYRSMS